MTKLKLPSAVLIAVAMLATPAMARTSHVTSRRRARDANASASPTVILTAVSAFQCRASADFLRRHRTGKIATSVITRLYAEKAAQRNGSVRLCEAQLWGAMCAFAEQRSACGVTLPPNFIQR